MTMVTAFRVLGRNRLRAGLTMLGIIIGVGAVIAMVVVMLLPPGPGTLWPIAMAIGGSVLAVAVLGGNMLGSGIRYLVAKMKGR